MSPKGRSTNDLNVFKILCRLTYLINLLYTEYLLYKRPSVLYHFFKYNVLHMRKFACSLWAESVVSLKLKNLQQETATLGATFPPRFTQIPTSSKRLWQTPQYQSSTNWINCPRHVQQTHTELIVFSLEDDLNWTTIKWNEKIIYTSYWN